MSLSLSCCQCGKSHKANARNFPIGRRENVEIKVSRKEAKITGQRFKRVNTITGYMCRWCLKKHVQREEQKRATERKRNESVGKTVSKQEPPREDSGNTGGNVQQGGKNNIWGRIRSIGSGIRRKVLQNNDQSRVPTKQPNSN
jgi:hypothetical protein